MKIKKLKFLKLKSIISVALFLTVGVLIFYILTITLPNKNLFGSFLVDIVIIGYLIGGGSLVFLLVREKIFLSILISLGYGIAVSILYQIVDQPRGFTGAIFGLSVIAAVIGMNCSWLLRLIFSKT